MDPVRSLRREETTTRPPAALSVMAAATRPRRSMPVNASWPVAEVFDAAAIRGATAEAAPDDGAEPADDGPELGRPLEPAPTDGGTSTEGLAAPDELLDVKPLTGSDEAPLPRMLVSTAALPEVRPLDVPPEAVRQFSARRLGMEIAHFPLAC